MHFKSLGIGALIVGCSSVSAQHHHYERDAHEPTGTISSQAAIAPSRLNIKRDNPKETGAPFVPFVLPVSDSTIDPAKVSAYKSDIHSLHSKVKADPMYTSMKEVMKTAVPQSYMDDMKTNAAAVRSKYLTAEPDWMKALPTDIHSFIASHKKADLSIYTKGIGPLPTGDAGKKGHGDKDEKKNDSKKNEASGMSVFSASIGAMIGALGLAVLLL